LVWFVLEAAPPHRDSMGNGSIIQPSEIQRMSAGTGVTHSEYNPARDQAVHFLQIWIVPGRRGLPPSYEQKRIALDDPGRLVLVAGPHGGDGAVTLGADVFIHAGRLTTGDRVVHEPGPGRHAWLQVARGVVRVLEHELHAGDGAAISDEAALAIAAVRPAEVLLFDLA
jgi:redox-sensitive bicupin YhaK (pirin superfamily)